MGKLTRMIGVPAWNSILKVYNEIDRSSDDVENILDHSYFLFKKKYGSNQRRLVLGCLLVRYRLRRCLMFYQLRILWNFFLNW